MVAAMNRQHRSVRACFAEQVVCFETSEALHMQQRVWYRAAAALVRAYAILVPALVVTVRHQKCKVQLSD